MRIRSTSYNDPHAPTGGPNNPLPMSFQNRLRRISTQQIQSYHAHPAQIIPLHPRASTWQYQQNPAHTPAGRALPNLRTPQPSHLHMSSTFRRPNSAPRQSTDKAHSKGSFTENYYCIILTGLWHAARSTVRSFAAYKRAAMRHTAVEEGGTARPDTGVRYAIHLRHALCSNGWSRLTATLTRCPIDRHDYT